MIEMRQQSADRSFFRPVMRILPTLNETDNSASVPWDLPLTGCTIVTIG